MNYSEKCLLTKEIQELIRKQSQSKDVLELHKLRTEEDLLWYKLDLLRKKTKKIKEVKELEQKKTEEPENLEMWSEEDFQERGLVKNNVPLGEGVKNVINKELKARKTEEKLKKYKSLLARVNKEIQERGIKQNKIAEKLGVSQVRISQLLTGSREFNGSELVNILDFLNFNII